MPHIQRPDGDNLEKFINDALNGILWKDDSQIVWTLRSKTTTKEIEGCTFLHVREIKNGLPDYEEILSILKEHINIEKGDLNASDEERALFAIPNDDDVAICGEHEEQFG